MELAFYVLKEDKSPDPRFLLLSAKARSMYFLGAQQGIACEDVAQFFNLR